MILSFSDTAWKSIGDALTAACGADGSSGSCTGSGLDLFPNVSEWHKADIVIGGATWKNVGIRLRSNSQLAAAWKARTFAFPFRITMDKWEDEFPTIKNQRFYGFQKLSLVSLADDSTLLRHQVASAAYRAKGVPAFRSTIVSVRIAHGTGRDDTIDAGCYSMREMLDGPMFKRWFSASGGNLYEPASFLGAADLSNTTAFGGEGVKDYSDIKAFMAALHSSDRTSDASTWRKNLVATFDVDGFIRWLAISTVLGDRGGYGYENGNYALYADQGKLHWMALDLDDALPSAAKSPKAYYRGVWHTEEVANGAALISYLLADPSYCEQYKTLLADYAASELSGGALPARVAALASQLLPSGSAAADEIKTSAYAATRKATIDSSLAAHACPWNN